MTAAVVHTRDQARLWSAAFALSALINVGLVLLIAFLIGLKGMIPARRDASPPPPAEATAMILPEMLVPVEVPASSPSSPAATPPELAQRPAKERMSAAVSYARTSADQESEAPESAAFIGARNTRAASDAPAIAGAPEMPSQKGTVSGGLPETTTSTYQDGELASDQVAGPDPSPGQATAAGEPAPASSSTRSSEANAQGAFPVDRPFHQDMPKAPPLEMKPVDPAPEKDDSKIQDSQTKAPPGFRGNEQKTKLSGSITRQGTSALDVEDTVLGRYHALLGRAVDKEWKSACNKHADFIAEGRIVVSFLLESNGKVRSLSIVEESGVGALQKGFTLESIHTSKIPPFPPELKKQLGGEPLEVSYSFKF